MDNMDRVALVKSILDQVRKAEDFQPLLDHIAEEVIFEVTTPDGIHEGRACRGKQAVIDYFRGIGPIVTFWQAEVFGNGDRVVVLGEEDFAIKNSGLSARSEFALVFHVRHRSITRLLIVEDLSALVDADGTAISRDQTRRPTLNRAPQRRFSPLLPGFRGHAFGIPS